MQDASVCLYKKVKELRGNNNECLLFGVQAIGVGDVVLGRDGRIVAIRSVSDDDQQSGCAKQEQMSQGEPCADRAGQLHRCRLGEDFGGTTKKHTQWEKQCKTN